MCKTISFVVIFFFFLSSYASFVTALLQKRNTFFSLIFFLCVFIFRTFVIDENQNYSGRESNFLPSHPFFLCINNHCVADFTRKGERKIFFYHFFFVFCTFAVGENYNHSVREMKYSLQHCYVFTYSEL